MQLFFAFTLLVSAILLFVVEPMFAKMVLPLLGGAPAVWNTCLVFYQAALLGGYLYAHFGAKVLGPRRQAVVHLVLMGLALVVLPVAVSEMCGPPPGDRNPIPWLLLVLSVSVGLPFLFISASAPMIQSWFSHTGHPAAKDPYFLYAGSNLGSMIGLLGYPLVLESNLTLHQQSYWWAVGYIALMLLTLGCAWSMWRSRQIDCDSDLSAAGPPAAEPGLDSGLVADAGPGGSSAPPDLRFRPVTWGRRLRWMALALVPSSLLLGVTSYMSIDLAAFPLLWAIPLALYLLTFVMVFARRRIIPHFILVRLQPLLIVLLAAVFFLIGRRGSQIAPMFLLSLLTFFVTALVCHGELANDRPANRYLTEFYLWMSVGGVAGGLFNALLAPVIFTEVLEFPLMIAAACMVRPGWRPRWRWLKLAEWSLLLWLVPAALLVAVGVRWHSEVGTYVVDKLPAMFTEWGKLLKKTPSSTWTILTYVAIGLAGGTAILLQRRPLRFGLAVLALLVVGRLASENEFRPLHIERSFFGVLRVQKDSYYGAHKLLHGSTSHGMQSCDPNNHDPWTYYHRNGPVGQIFSAIGYRLVDIGVVGLGTGTMAAYGHKDNYVTFFEIDPAVERIARNKAYFHYLSDCEAKQLKVVLGDARLKLAKYPSDFDILLIDAFSSDAIPAHLLTKEAIDVYFSKLAPNGVLAVHISNRHLDLRPVLGNLAKACILVARICEDEEGDDSDEEDKARFGSTWILLARHELDLGSLATSPNWKELPPDDKQRLWTDDFSNVLDVLKWEPNWKWFDPRNWIN